MSTAEIVIAMAILLVCRHANLKSGTRKSHRSASTSFGPAWAGGLVDAERDGLRLNEACLPTPAHTRRALFIGDDGGDAGGDGTPSGLPLGDGGSTPLVVRFSPSTASLHRSSRSSMISRTLARRLEDTRILALSTLCFESASKTMESTNGNSATRGRRRMHPTAEENRQARCWARCEVPCAPFSRGPCHSRATNFCTSGWDRNARHSNMIAVRSACTPRGVRSSSSVCHRPRPSLMSPIERRQPAATSCIRSLAALRSSDTIGSNARMRRALRCVAAASSIKSTSTCPGACRKSRGTPRTSSSTDIDA